MSVVFRGTVPSVRCGTLPDCARPVSADDEHCGNPAHVITTRDLPPLPPDVSGVPLHRTRLIVKEAYELAGSDARGDDGRLGPSRFDPNRLHVARQAVAGFAEHHGVDETVARAELRAFAAAAVATGQVEEGPSGCHDVY